jgi:4a-hydroxytetrahydrobiopterin dehydratase
VATRLEPDKLASASCTTVDASMPALASDEVARLSAGLDRSWDVQSDRLVRSIAFTTFGAAFAFATRVALLAETQNHHPTMEVAWGRLVVTLQTDAIGALTGNDFIMAAKVDRLIARGMGIKDG